MKAKIGGIPLVKNTNLININSKQNASHQLIHKITLNHTNFLFANGILTIYFHSFSDPEFIEIFNCLQSSSIYDVELIYNENEIILKDMKINPMQEINIQKGIIIDFIPIENSSLNQDFTFILSESPKREPLETKASFYISSSSIGWNVTLSHDNPNDAGYISKLKYNVHYLLANKTQSILLKYMQLTKLFLDFNTHHIDIDFYSQGI